MKGPHEAVILLHLCNGPFLGIIITEGELHVRLAGGEPDLTDEHILEIDLVFALHRHRAGFGGGQHRIELEHPFAGGVGHGLLHLTGEFHSHLFALVGPSPDGNLLVALKDHFAVDGFRQADIGVGGLQKGKSNERYEQRQCTGVLFSHCAFCSITDRQPSCHSNALQLCARSDQKMTTLAPSLCRFARE